MHTHRTRESRRNDACLWNDHSTSDEIAMLETENTERKRGRSPLSLFYQVRQISIAARQWMKKRRPVGVPMPTPPGVDGGGKGMSNCPEFQVPFRPAAETKTLRDEFAMAAMQGLMTPMTFDLTVEDISEIAIISYLQADAMLTKGRRDELAQRNPRHPRRHRR